MPPTRLACPRGFIGRHRYELEKNYGGSERVKMPPNKKSVVWEFFKKSSDDGNKVICVLLNIKIQEAARQI